VLFAQAIPRSTCAVTLNSQGCLAAYAPTMCSDQDGALAHGACFQLLKGEKAAFVEQGDEGSAPVFGLFPASCKKAFVCGEEGGRAVVVGMPAGAREVSEAEAKWLVSLATMPTR
jgi:hypothetical protein